MGVGPGDPIKEVNILKVKRAEFHTLPEGRDKHGKKKTTTNPVTIGRNGNIVANSWFSI